MHHVRDAKYVSGYALQIDFEDGSRRLVDLEPYLDGDIFEPLKDLAYFRRVAVNHDIDTIVWPNDADFSPDFLYEVGKAVESIGVPA